MQSLPRCKLIRLMPGGPVLSSGMSHSSMVLMEVEGGASAHSQSQLHRRCVAHRRGGVLVSVCPWAVAISSEQSLHHGTLFNSREQWHGLTASPQKVLCSKSPEADSLFDFFIVPSTLQYVLARSFSLCFPAWLANKESVQNPSCVLSCSERWCTSLWCSTKP